MTPLPCIHLGAELNGRQIASAGLGRNRKWFRCDHAQKPLGEIVCTCKCKRCPMYAPESDDAGIPS